MATGTRFLPVLDDPIEDTSTVKRVACLSGKLYYDLARQRDQRAAVADKVAFVRVEELCPFPLEELQGILERRYPNAEEIVWVQEEPRNQGAFTHVRPWVEAAWRNVGKTSELRYVGRAADAVPAPGVAKLYSEQQSRVVDGVFEGL